MDEVGQSAALRDIFARAWADVRPRRLLVLGCTTGRDFDAVDRAVTERSVGVDLNREYLDAARRRLERLGGTAVHGDVLQAALPCSAFDLVHAALIFEYVDAAVLFRRIAEWLAPDGVCCAVTQNRAAGVASVSTTAYASLRALDGHMSLHAADQLSSHALHAGLERTSQWDVPLPRGKSFSVSTFRRARAG